MTNMIVIEISMIQDHDHGTDYHDQCGGFND